MKETTPRKEFKSWFENHMPRWAGLWIIVLIVFPVLVLVFIIILSAVYDEKLPMLAWLTFLHKLDPRTMTGILGNFLARHVDRILLTINFPINLMFEQPDGWLFASLPKIESTTMSILELTRNIDSQTSLIDAQAIVQQRRWLTLTGVEPLDSHFSIIVPIHNEQRSLPSFFGALLMSEIPSTVDAQIIFVINASSDQSASLIKNRLARINPVTESLLPDSIYDLQRSNIAYQVCCDKIRFLIVETQTPGKANALNLGNEIALQKAHDIAMNIDANNWVEPDAIALHYGRARQSFVDRPELNAVIVNSNEFAPTREAQAEVLPRDKTQKAEVTGWMFAWSTSWLHENNGFFKNVIEDYATGLLALSQEKQIVTSGANVWGYSVANFSDENKEVIRYIYGAMQLAERFEDNPLAMQILLEDFHYLRPLRSRMDYYFLSRIREGNGPTRIIRGILRWFLNELFILRARQKVRKDPHGQTWRPIHSTK